MKFTKTYLLLAAFLFVSCFEIFDAANADSPIFGSPAESQALRETKAENLIDKAIETYQKLGREKGLAEFGKPDSPYCTQYDHGAAGLIVKTLKGKILSYCKYRCLQGKYVHELQTPDGSRPFHLIHEALIKSPTGFAKSDVVTNENPFTGRVTHARLLAKEYDGLMFMNVVYEDTPIKGLKPDEKICEQGKLVSEQ